MEEFFFCVVILLCEIKNLDYNMILWIYCVDKICVFYKIKFFVFDVRKIDNLYIFFWLFVYFVNLFLSSMYVLDFLN